MDFSIPKRVYCIAFTVFERTKLYPFQNLSLGFILKIFLKFRTFQPRYSSKIYSYRKKERTEIGHKRRKCSHSMQVLNLMSSK